MSWLAVCTLRTGVTKMDIYTYIKKDHRKVDSLFKKVLLHDDPVMRKKIYGQIKNELEVHAAGENATFYDILQKESPVMVPVEQEAKEHHYIQELLKKLDHLDITSSEWMFTFKKLAKFVHHHMEEEEKEVFPLAHQVLSKTSEINLAKKMDAFKKGYKRTLT